MEPAPRRASTVRWLALLGMALPITAQAGLSLDEALARHRELFDAAVALTPSTPGDDLADGITVSVGNHGLQTPALLGQADGRGSIQWRGRMGFDAGVRGRLGIAWRDIDDPQFSLDGTELSVPLAAGRAYVSAMRRHWGPHWSSSLIYDAAAPALPAFGWRKTDATAFEIPWLSWLGPWTADFFAGRMSGHIEPRYPWLIGARVQIAPLPGLELGASRVIQWGGKGRPQTARSLWRALLGIDNAKPGQRPEDEPGNQLAGFDARFTVRASDTQTFSIFGQAIGEDEAGGMPSRYIGSAGADAAFKLGDASLRVFAEGANTVMGGIAGEPRPGSTYRHHLYQQGYTLQGRPLGHPAGGDVRLGTLGVLGDHGAVAAMLMVHGGKAYDRALLFPTPGALRGGDAVLSWRADQNVRIGASVTHWRDPVSRQTRVQLWWQQALP